MNSAHKILKVALPVPLRREYDYLPPVSGVATPQPGARVRVPFGNRELIGVITTIADSSSLAAQKLKPVAEILDSAALVPPPVLELCHWCASYYHHPIGEVMATALPGDLRAGKSVASTTENYYRLSASFLPADAESLTRAPRQAEIIALIAQHEQGMSEHALKALGLTGSPLKALLDRGWLILERVEATAKAPVSQILAEAPLTLNAEQAQAAALIQRTMGEFTCILLEGVTGSGKTEVYMQVINAVLENNQAALVLVPEISLTPQTVARFRRRFNTRIETLHSGLTHKERARIWMSAAKGDSAIIIGTRSAVFTPVPNLGIIIVDEEHDLSFKQQDGMRYSARDVAVVRAQQANIPVVLGSATPSMESLHNAACQRYQRVVLNERAGTAQPPEFQLVDIRSRPLQEGLSQPLIHAITEQIEAGNQVLVFINRRGFAPTLMCHACAWIATCDNCDTRMTLHRQPSQLQCHHCGSQRPIPASCATCGQQELKAIGVGTERSEAGLQALFPNVPVIRVDRDSTRAPRALRNQLKVIQEGNPCILVGTQMLAKGHHFPEVTLVAVVDADAGLFSADFRGIERMAQLITQVGGRAGRADKPGKVLLQTHQPEHPHSRTLIEQGYSALMQQLMEERRLAGLPPFRHWVIIRAEATDETKPRQLLEHLQAQLQGYLTQNPNQQIDCFGPIPALIYRRSNRFRLLQILQAENRAELHRLLRTLTPELEALPLARQVRWSIDIDPQECF